MSVATDDPIPATRDRPGSYDAIETAKPGEPLFPLQGGDPFAPAAVKCWIDQARGEGMRLCEEHDQDTPEHDRGLKLLRKASDAEQIVWQMLAWQRGHRTEAAAPPKGSSYSGIDLATTDEAQARARLIRAAGRLSNLTAELLFVAELLAELRTSPGVEVDLRECAATVKQAAMTIEPRRGMERS